jgi:hypothetical protein
MLATLLYTGWLRQWLRQHSDSVPRVWYNERAIVRRRGAARRAAPIGTTIPIPRQADVSELLARTAPTRQRQEAVLC